MAFDELVIRALGPIFEKYGLRTVERSGRSVILMSDTVRINIAHNKMENSNSIWVCRAEEKYGIPIDSYTMENYFRSDLRVELLPIDIFLHNLALFFNGAGKVLLQDLETLDRLKEFSNLRNKEYTRDLIAQQNLSFADKAWEMSSYSDFIKWIDETDTDDLSPSYKLKYKIALKKIGRI